MKKIIKISLLAFLFVGMSGFTSIIEFTTGESNMNLVKETVMKKLSKGIRQF
jgi:hypothetical protein